VSETLEAAEDGVAHRLADLEIRVNAAEDLVDTLNHTIFRQQQQLDLLQAQLRHLHRQLSSASESNASSAPRDLRDEIPPHY
jgi:SlyX protein